ncbi:hypothetical protein JCM9957A_03590 [Kineosporia succinea]|uniref:Uncharacterized protein n=1 Tax=Kineosporia succinea TaxID=84632 RepID=A0ABT9PEK4_9ACTN|nr:hypothetical protein [Kineosporia succinea]
MQLEKDPLSGNGTEFAQGRSCLMAANDGNVRECPVGPEDDSRLSGAYQQVFGR